MYQKENNLVMLVQCGNLGSSVIDHLISPLAGAGNLKKVLLFCHRPGPVISNVEYHCPPKLLTKIALLAVLWESANLFRFALFGRCVTVAGFYLNPHGIIAFLVAKLTRKKLIISLIAGRAEFYTQGSLNGIDFDTTAPPWHGRLFLGMLKHTDSIITTGSVTKRFLIRHGIAENRIYPIISPVNTSRFNRQEDIPKVYDVLSVGHVYLIKHHEVLLQAMSEVKKKYPGIKACIVGDGPLRKKLVRLAIEMGIKENVDFVGFQNDVSHYYNSSRIFIHTSETEGFPNVILEAMICGLPCVVSNCGDVVDLVKDGFNSQVIQEFNNYKGFAIAIINLLEDEELYRTISLNALKTAESLSAKAVRQKWELILAKCTETEEINDDVQTQNT